MLTIIVTTVLIGVAAIYVTVTVNHNSRPAPADSNAFSAMPPGAGTTDQLQTQSDNNQMVNNAASTQLQTGPSSVQQAPANTPQRAGSSSPGDPTYY